ncbi:hypothetical protein CR152_21895 [Massilia violaceinigra]|uniref:DUF4214 domain-containing protein n=1 Tax=Massilia violaceinigra TaxID=2045208 RepID=A0A2D2DPH8_9BURK|nr:DUF4214 domain-containing protein [Massilia violaceinigra]ATQ76878.1 hypothetical protein CR152_21895 [Massilia violaceinigra]
MTYKTIDSLPDLSEAQMRLAQNLAFAPVSIPGAVTGWDLSALFWEFAARTPGDDVFAFSATAGSVYDIHSTSARDPSVIKVYDRFGNAITAEYDLENRGDHAAYMNDFIAPYSGIYYVSAGWIQTAESPYVTVFIAADENPEADVPNIIKGTPVSDFAIFLTHLNDHVDGGAGTDTVCTISPVSAFSMVVDAGIITLTERSGYKSVDVLRNIEVIEFPDTKIDMEYVGLSQALYVSYFGRAADVNGLKSFQAQLKALDAPASVGEFSARYATDAAVKSLIDSFGTSSESKALYSGDNKAFVKAVFSNLLNRVPGQAGLDFWSGAIDSGALTRANASLSIMAGALANNSTQGHKDAALVRTKIDVASNFTFALETEAASAAYNGAEAAAVARTLLRSLTADTDILDFQASVKLAIGKLPPVPRSAPEHLADLPPADSDAPPVLLIGIDSAHPAALLG